jgi:hypothetical protein
VNLEKLARKLKRDLAANPKRAALLGLMLVVAGYFWAPLVSKWLGKNTRKEARAEGMVILGDDLPIEQRSQTKGQPRWDKLLAWMEADPRMASHKPAQDLHPFGRPSAVSAVAEKPRAEEAAASPVALDITPQAAGAVLNGVLVGARQKQATINGETYRLGERIPLAGKESTGPVEFELLQVRKDGVVLGRSAKLYDLKLEQTKLAGRDKIERTDGSQ